MMKEHRGLVWVLVGLVFVIVGLTVGIVVVMNRDGDGEEITTQEIETQEIAEGCYYDEYAGEIACDFDEKVLKEKQLIDEVYRINEGVQQSLDKESVDMDTINQLYAAGVAKAIELDRTDYVIVITNDVTGALLSKGLKRESLDILLSVDFSLFSEPNQYRFYDRIIELAKELNDSEVVAKYQTLRSQVEPEYMAEYEATQEAAKRAAEEDYGSDIDLNSDNNSGFGNEEEDK